jgi:hypothetical protein
VETCSLLVVANLIRSVDAEGGFSNSKRQFCLVADDDPLAGPSCATLARKARTEGWALTDGWLDLSEATGKVDAFFRALSRRTRTRRYCMLAKSGRDYVLYYYNSDVAATPRGFVNACQFELAHHPSKPWSTFRLKATAVDRATMVVTATARSRAELEAWVVGFVNSGALYVEQLDPTLQQAAANDIYGFTALDLGERPISFDAFRGKVVLVVNVSVAGSDTALNLTQLQALQSQHRDDGLQVVAFPSSQLASRQSSRAEIRATMEEWANHFQFGAPS